MCSDKATMQMNVDQARLENPSRTPREIFYPPPIQSRQTPPESAPRNATQREKTVKISEDYNSNIYDPLSYIG